MARRPTTAADRRRGRRRPGRRAELELRRHRRCAGSASAVRPPGSRASTSTVCSPPRSTPIAATSRCRRRCSRFPGWPPARTRIAIEVTGLRKVAASNAFIVVDAFEVTLLAVDAERIARSADRRELSGRTVGAELARIRSLPGRRSLHSSRRRASGVHLHRDGRPMGRAARLRQRHRTRLRRRRARGATSTAYAPIQEEFQAAMFSVIGPVHTALTP